MATLFDKLTIGNIELSNRIIYAPMTRSRADDDGVQPDYTAEYYAQRASGGLLITAAEIEAMETVPELVFLNCCHVGKVDATVRDGNKLYVGEDTPSVRVVDASAWLLRWPTNPRPPVTICTPAAPTIRSRGAGGVCSGANGCAIWIRWCWKRARSISCSSPATSCATTATALSGSAIRTC